MSVRAVLHRLFAWAGIRSPSIDASFAGQMAAARIADDVQRAEDAYASLAWRALRHRLWPDRWPALTPEEQAVFDVESERRRRIPPAPVPDWWSRSPLAQKARLRRQRKQAARRGVA